jgi:CubicO group peptidase (beta-lactamase class C family)
LNKKIILLTLLVVITSTAVFFYPKVSNMLYTATGFSAKNVCSGHFISGFDVQDIIDEALIPVDSAFSLVSVDLDKINKSVETSVLGLFSRDAIYNVGVGCTLLAIGQENINHKVKPLAFTLDNEHNPLPWPEGEGEVNEYVDGIDYLKLSAAIHTAFSEPLPEDTRRTKAIAVIYKGQLIAEQYATGVNQNTPLLSWSMAKSITTLQVGLLVNDGLLDIFQPANVPLWQNEATHNKITLDHLLRMSSGLAFTENYGGASDAPYMLSIAPSAAHYAEDKPLIHEPNTFWAYSSGTSNIIAGIVKRTIGGDFQQYYEYTQNKLFKPLNIKTAQLEPDSAGTFIGSSYIYASARDWAKLGQLMLQDGVWLDKRILPKGWVNYANSATNTDPLNHYGAQFWLNGDPDDKNLKRTWPTVPNDTYSMNGYQGQYVVIIPSKDLVVVRLGFTTPGEDKGIEALLAGVVSSIIN